MQTASILHFEPVEVKTRNIAELTTELQVFIRIASHLRSEKIRNVDQIQALERNIDALRQSLGFAPVVQL